MLTAQNLLTSNFCRRFQTEAVKRLYMPLHACFLTTPQSTSIRGSYSGCSVNSSVDWCHVPRGCRALASGWAIAVPHLHAVISVDLKKTSLVVHHQNTRRQPHTSLPMSNARPLQEFINQLYTARSSCANAVEWDMELTLGRSLKPKTTQKPGGS